MKKKIKKHKPQHIYCDTYGINYYISYGISREAYRDSVKRILKCEPAKATASGCATVYERDDGNVIYWLWTKKKNISHLAHEIFHVIYFSLSDRGFRLSDESQEAFAYQIEFLMDKVCR